MVSYMKSSEQEFAAILEDVKYNARLNGGFIAEEEVLEAFEALELSKEQLDMVFDYLKQNNIGIGTPLSDEEMLSKDDRDILEEYRNELKDVPTLTDGEKRVAVMEAINGDVEAQTKLINHFLPQVVEISRLYSSQGVLVEDLIGEGNLALSEGVLMLGAIEEPEEADGMLTKLIMDAMEELIAESNTENSKEQKVADKVNDVADKARELSESLGRKISVEELAEFSGISKKAIEEAIRLSGKKIEDIE